ncbi:ParB/RepB/Spo0J family partition protein [Sporocytophaga myxococcoides]|uniref:ParB/RepB/Spo0J family partition protein n=1 Tax=Sporocytophaga myxococcoides TaxID=153721 RepID=UPI0004107F9F|nr:ParB/RepB/Spo0J family partition protein [Sporocytophaga myxococcoides]
MNDKKPQIPAKKSVLGRGLGALLQDSDTAKPEKTVEVVVERAPESAINEIPVDSIEVNPYQPRTHFDQEALQELSESIKVQGIIQPITVRQLSPGKYQLISGERRLQATRLAQIPKITAYIRTANDQQMLEMALIENIQRENLNALEIALSYQRLISECSLKQEELGDRVGKNRTTVTNYLRLLKLPPDIQAAVRDNRISMGHARALITIERIDDQLSIFKKILEEELSVRKTEDLVRSISQPSSQAKVSESKSEDKKTYFNPEIVHIQTKLSTHFGTKININCDKQNKGEIKIPFVNADDLNRILDILNF